MQPILLLHGAIGASDQLEPLKGKLSKDFEVHTMNFSGHGGRPYGNEPFSISLFASEVKQYLNDNHIEQIDIFGYSMGGYVALYLAKHHPELVGRVVTLATKFHWDEETAAKEVKMINAEKIKEKVPAFAAALEKRHHPNDWVEVLEKTKEMLRSLGRQNALSLEDYKEIEIPTLVLIGDQDKMVTLEETLNVYRFLPHAHMGMIPKTLHPIEQTNLEHLAFTIKQHVLGENT